MSKRFQVLWLKENWKRLPHPFRWVIAATTGSTLVILGLIFMVLPGPGIPLVISGLAILATEFTWAEIVLNRTRHHVHRAIKRVRRKD